MYYQPYQSYQPYQNGANQTFANQSVANQPVANKAATSQSITNQSLTNQPITNAQPNFNGNNSGQTTPRSCSDQSTRRRVPFHQLPQVPVEGMLPLEMSYIENILRLNRGKIARVYMTFEGRVNDNRQQLFEGVIEAAGRDHIILSDPQTGQRYLLLMVYLDYVEFDEEIEYDYPFA
ncbi:spore coat protein GerQ [Anaerobacillus arseniciselenatis]|uniref:spore coat protein GerQ n=1 Tax=Anaerobacillus arseniciselenatis TaxID=85682 RepID=UPI000ABBD905|nr:spore coat protein GerQ [Anaerobacillus arseniciselenatis]